VGGGEWKDVRCAEAVHDLLDSIELVLDLFEPPLCHRAALFRLLFRV